MNNPMMQMMQQMLGRGNNNPMAMFQNNPMFQRAQKMTEGKSPDEIKKIAENLCKERGINMEDAMKQFQQQMGGMLGGMK